MPSFKRPSKVVSDTSPINYVIQIGQERLFAMLFETVAIPEAVRSELLQPGTPTAVREAIEARPEWLVIEPAPLDADPSLARLHAGERETILLAAAQGASLIIMDERPGVLAARRLGLPVTGTLGVLDLAAERGLIDLAEVFARLRDTSFRYRPILLELLLARRAVVDVRRHEDPR